MILFLAAGAAAQVSLYSEPGGSAQPAMGALVDKWVERRAAALRPSTVYHLALAARRFLGHLAATAPEIHTFAAVKHEHVIGWMNAMATGRSSKTGRPL